MNYFKKIFGLNKNENYVTEVSVKENDDVLQKFKEANQLYTAGFYEPSLKLIEEVIIASRVNNWKYLAFKANVQEDLKKYHDAIATYSKAIEWSNDEVVVYALFHQIGFCYLTLGNNTKAEEFYTFAIDLKTKLVQRGATDIEGMDAGVMLGVPFKRMYNNRGNARKNLNKLEQAWEDSQSALRIDPYYANPYLLAGQIKQLQGDIDQALSLLEQSIKLGNKSAEKTRDEILATHSNKNKETTNIEDPTILFDKALRMCDLGLYKEAIGVGNDLINNYQSPTGYYILGLAYTLVENYELAIEYGLKTYQYFPNEANNLNRLGVGYCSLGSIKLGVEYFKIGMNLGDSNCRQNFNYWISRM